MISSASGSSTRQFVNIYSHNRTNTAGMININSGDTWESSCISVCTCKANCLCFMWTKTASGWNRFHTLQVPGSMLARYKCNLSLMSSLHLFATRDKLLLILLLLHFIVEVLIIYSLNFFLQEFRINFVGTSKILVLWSYITEWYRTSSTNF